MSDAPDLWLLLLAGSLVLILSRLRRRHQVRSAASSRVGLSS